MYVIRSQADREGALWYAVNIKPEADRNLSGWIRADMLRLMHADFTDIRKVVVGRNMIVGLKADGTVVAAGEKSTGMFELASVQTLPKLVDIAAGICTVVGVDAAGQVHDVGNYSLAPSTVSGAEAIYMIGSDFVALCAGGGMASQAKSVARRGRLRPNIAPHGGSFGRARAADSLATRLSAARGTHGEATASGGKGSTTP